MTFQMLTSMVSHRAAAAAGDSHPLLDIDLTVLLQLLLFGVVFFASRALLFEPYLRLRARREQGIDGARAEAQRMTSEADARLVDYERKLASARASAAEKQRAIRAEGAAHEQQVLEEARKTTQEAWDVAQAKVRSDVQTARTELLASSQDIAKKMISRLLGRSL